MGASGDNDRRWRLRAFGGMLARDRMDPYASPKESKIGANRPKIQHVAETSNQRRTRREREAEKDAVAAERRAIKKSARQHLKRQLLSDLSDTE